MVRGSRERPFRVCCVWGLLGGSWVVLSRLISRITMVITYIRGLITPLITSHVPPSRALGSESTPKAAKPPYLEVHGKWGYKSPNIGYNHSYHTYNPTYNYP